MDRNELWQKFHVKTSKKIYYNDKFPLFMAYWRRGRSIVRLWTVSMVESFSVIPLECAEDNYSHSRCVS
jgi:hypothetical protein